MKHIFSHTLFLILVACTPVRPGSSELPTSTMSLSPDRVAAIDTVLASMVEIGMFNGTVVIDQGGEIVFKRSYGFANYELNLPFTDQTRFRIASLSKNMTNSALASMLVQKKIRMEDTLSLYLPDFPNGDRITIEHLVTHQSGIPHTNSQHWGDGSIRLTHDEIIDRLSLIPLDFEPGSQQRYSNGGFAVLTRAMEVAAEQSYGEILRETVFEPFGMHTAGHVSDSRLPIANLAIGYEPGRAIGERRQSRFYAVETRPGGGSLYASSDDVTRFFQAAFRDQMKGAKEYPELFGGTGKARSASGRSPGYYMDVYFDQENDLMVVSTANNYAAEFQWAENIARMALSDTSGFEIPEIKSVRTTLQNHPWVGLFRNENPNFAQQLEIRQTPTGDLYMLDHKGLTQTALIPLEEGGFLDTLYYGKCRMASEEISQIECHRFYDGGFKQILIRRN